MSYKKTPKITRRKNRNQMVINPKKGTVQYANSDEYYTFSRYQDQVNWSVKTKLSENSIPWGFDNALVKSKTAWKKFLDQFGFKLVAEQPDTHYLRSRIYRNSDNVYLVTQTESENQFGELTLGHVRFEFPHTSDFHLILAAFRGYKTRKHNTRLTKNDDKGILIAVNDETPSQANFI